MLSALLKDRKYHRNGKYFVVVVVVVVVVLCLYCFCPAVLVSVIATRFWKLFRLIDALIFTVLQLGIRSLDCLK